MTQGLYDYPEGPLDTGLWPIHSAMPTFHCPLPETLGPWAELHSDHYLYCRQKASHTCQPAFPAQLADAMPPAQVCCTSAAIAQARVSLCRQSNQNQGLINHGHRLCSHTLTLWTWSARSTLIVVSTLMPSVPGGAHHRTAPYI